MKIGIGPVTIGIGREREMKICVGGGKSVQNGVSHQIDGVELFNFGNGASVVIDSNKRTLVAYPCDRVGINAHVSSLLGEGWFPISHTCIPTDVSPFSEIRIRELMGERVLTVTQKSRTRLTWVFNNPPFK